VKGRVLLTLLASGVQLAAALVVLGVPGLGAAWDFFTSRNPTVASALAASRLTVTLVALAMVLWALVWTVRVAVRSSRAATRRRQTLAGAAVLATGLLILAAGLSHRLSSPSVALDGGSVKEASQALAR
jgi:uncharacterized membrane-anchored protein